tara:strand:+ start:2192 stop:2713 length:522 start_codon:yes stop_codon:yes gene_type:complete
MTDDEDYEREYREHLGEDEQPMPVLCESAIEANDRLRALDYWRKEKSSVESVASEEMGRIEVWRDRELRRVEKRIAWNENILREYLEARGKSTLSLPYGTLKARKGRERIDVPQEEVFLHWAEVSGRSDLVRKKETVSPDKKKILEWVRETGEEPPGVELNKGADTFSVNTDG